MTSEARNFVRVRQKFTDCQGISGYKASENWGTGGIHAHLVLWRQPIGGAALLPFLVVTGQPHQLHQLVDTIGANSDATSDRGQKGIIEMIRRSFLVPTPVKSPSGIDLLLSGYKFQGV